jgi:hypothetical protein
VQIKLSRHAKRRARLYQIPEATILKVLEEKDFIYGDHEVIKYIEGFKYPIKIVVTVAQDAITVKTNYPLKKGRKA